MVEGECQVLLEKHQRSHEPPAMSSVVAVPGWKTSQEYGDAGTAFPITQLPTQPHALLYRQIYNLKGKVLSS